MVKSDFQIRLMKVEYVISDLQCRNAEPLRNFITENVTFCSCEIQQTLSQTSYAYSRNFTWEESLRKKYIRKNYEMNFHK